MHEVEITIDGKKGLPLKCPPGTIIEVRHPDGSKAYTKIVKE
jgi:hypothetical protein